MSEAAVPATASAPPVQRRGIPAVDFQTNPVAGGGVFPDYSGRVCGQKDSWEEAGDRVSAVAAGY